MNEQDSQPVHLRQDGKVQIGGFTFDVNNIRIDRVFNNMVSNEQTVELTLVLTRPLNSAGQDKT